jgi:hypothetical protein
MSWIKLERDSRYVEYPFLTPPYAGRNYMRKSETMPKYLGKGMFKRTDGSFPKYKDSRMCGGESYSPAHNLSVFRYPPYHQPRARMFYD